MIEAYWKGIKFVILNPIEKNQIDWTFNAKKFQQLNTIERSKHFFSLLYCRLQMLTTYYKWCKFWPGMCDRQIDRDRDVKGVISMETRLVEEEMYVNKKIPVWLWMKLDLSPPTIRGKYRSSLRSLLRSQRVMFIVVVKVNRFGR